MGSAPAFSQASHDEDWAQTPPSAGLLRPASTLEAAFVFTLSALVLFLFFNSHPFHTRGEAREALVVKAMIEQQNYILPLRGGFDIPSKPPMFHWLSALAAKIAGNLKEDVLRFPSLFCSALALTGFFIWARNYFAPRTVALTTLILLSSFEWLRNSLHARVDMCFVAFFTLALLAFERALHSGKTAKLWHLGAAFAAAATLAKGPAALVLIFAIAVSSLLIEKRAWTGAGWQALLQRKSPFWGLVFAGVLSFFLAGAWYCAAYLEHGDSFLHRQLFQENFSRLLPIEGEDPGHKKPFFFAAIDLCLGFLPWSLLFPIVLHSQWRQPRRIPGKPQLFLLLWMAIVFVAVTLSQSKRTVYLLPVFPPLALFFAEGILVGVPGKSRAVSLLRQTFLGIGAFLALSAIALIFLRQGWGVEFFLPGKNREVLNVLAFSLRQDPQLFLVPLLLGVASYSIYRALSNDGLAKSCALLALCFLSVAYLIQSTFVTLLAQLQSPKCFAEAVQKNLSKDQNLYQWQDRFFAMHYYLDRDLPVAHEMRTLPNYSCLLVKEENLFSLDAEGRKYRIAITSDNAAADGRHKLVLVCLD